jgi:hypothetical protein
MIPFVSCFYLLATSGLYHLLRLLKGGVGLIAALGMKAYKLETLTDEVRKHLPYCFSAAESLTVIWQQWGIAQKTKMDEETLNDTALKDANITGS